MNTTPAETVLVQMANENLQYRLQIAGLEARIRELEATRAEDGEEGGEAA